MLGGGPGVCGPYPGHEGRLLGLLTLALALPLVAVLVLALVLAAVEVLAAVVVAVVAGGA